MTQGSHYKHECYLQSLLGIVSLPFGTLEMKVKASLRLLLLMAWVSVLNILLSPLFPSISQLILAVRRL